MELTDGLAAYHTQWIELEGILFTYAGEQIADAINKQRRFVHYTSASVAESILTNKEMWMRNATTMNDFLEIQHGQSCVRFAMNSIEGKAMSTLLDATFPGISKEIGKKYDEWLVGAHAKTFLTCFSAHDDDEDFIGRLSMWRAYGGNAGVALVFKGEPFYGHELGTSAVVSPVFYGNEAAFNDEFAKVYIRLVADKHLLASLPREEVRDSFVRAFRYATLATKHLGFREEQEWRVIHSPADMIGHPLRRTLENVRGIPQHVYHLPLESAVGTGRTLDSMLDRVLIGPSQYPFVLAQAFDAVMGDQSISQIQKKLVICDIPLRQPF